MDLSKTPSPPIELGARTESDPKSSKRKNSSEGKEKPDEPPAKKRKEKKKPDWHGGFHDAPLAWAACWADLCETLMWFNAWMRPTHTDIAKGVLGYCIDRNSGCRFINDEVVIISISGGYKKDEDGKHVLMEDQTQKNNVFIRSWMKSMENKTPIGLIIGSHSQLLEGKLPHRFNIMDFFIATDLWYEPTGTRRCLRATVRLQKLNLSEKSWWATEGSPDPLPVEQRVYGLSHLLKTCDKCGVECPQVYSVGWMCCKKGCDNFWKHNGVQVPASEFLKFDDGFLAYRFNLDRETCMKQAKCALIPTMADITEKKHSMTWINRTRGPGFNRIVKDRNRGMVCPECGRCVPLIFLGRWKCEVEHFHPGGVEPPREHEKGCTWEHTFDGNIVTLTEEQLRAIDLNRRTIDRLKQQPYKGPYAYRQHKYQLKAGKVKIGTVTHFVASNAMNAKPNGADDMFKCIQDSGLGLRRHRVQYPRAKGTLSNNFLANIGMPYNFFIPNRTRSFKDFHESYPGLKSAYARLDWAFHQACEADKEEYKRPNEMLIIGYIDGQKIGWHDDGNGKLGPSIATLCLGAQSKMSFRMRLDYYYGLTASGRPLMDDPVLSGCQDEEFRRDLKAKLAEGTITYDEYDDACKKVLTRKKNGSPPKALTIDLYHGDIVVMNGVDIQKYYEHTVDSITNLRFALTARHLIPDTEELKEEMWKWFLDKSVGDCELKDDEKYKGKG